MNSPNYGEAYSHIEPDWLLIYQIFKNELILSATATGSHSDLFK
jgi:mRNA interferase YafQ